MATVLLWPHEMGFSKWFVFLDSFFLLGATSSKIPSHPLLMVFAGSASAQFLRVKLQTLSGLLLYNKLHTQLHAETHFTNIKRLRG